SGTPIKRTSNRGHPSKDASNRRTSNRGHPPINPGHTRSYSVGVQKRITRDTHVRIRWVSKNEPFGGCPKTNHVLHCASWNMVKSDRSDEPGRAAQAGRAYKNKGL